MTKLSSSLSVIDLVKCLKGTSLGKEKEDRLFHDASVRHSATLLLGRHGVQQEHSTVLYLVLLMVKRGYLEEVPMVSGFQGCTTKLQVIFFFFFLWCPLPLELSNCNCLVCRHCPPPSFLAQVTRQGRELMQFGVCDTHEWIPLLDWVCCCLLAVP